MERFKNDTYYHIHLPFFGEWRMSQGHAGGITHKGDWRFAWDFDIVDETGKTYRPPGKTTSDFYCYGLPVLAPAAGYVATVVDDVDDNEILSRTGVTPLLSSMVNIFFQKSATSKMAASR